MGFDSVLVLDEVVDVAVFSGSFWPLVPPMGKPRMCSLACCMAGLVSLRNNKAFSSNEIKNQLYLLVMVPDK